MLRNYLLIAFKVLTRRSFFTAVNLFGIAFTLMVLIVVTALADEFLGNQAPQGNADRVLGVYRVVLKGPRMISIGSPGYRLLEQTLYDLPGVEEVSIVSQVREGASYLHGARIDSQVRRTDGAYWRIHTHDFLEGGPFTDADVDDGRMVAVINNTTRERFFENRSALGEQLVVDGQRFSVVGVVDDVSMMQRMAFADVWAPLTTSKSSAYKHQLRGGFVGLILARDRAAFSEIKAELQQRFESFQLPDPKVQHTLLGGADTIFERLARPLGDEDQQEPPVGKLKAIIVLCAVLFMALPAINMTNLNVSRILERAPEIGVRKAFGASSMTLVGQFVVENLILTSLGAVLGVIGAAVALEAIEASGIIPYAELGMNPTVFAWGLVMTIIFGLLSGVYPAWKMSRLHPAVALTGRSS